MLRILSFNIRWHKLRAVQIFYGQTIRLLLPQVRHVVLSLKKEKPLSHKIEALAWHLTAATFIARMEGY
jgi:hypothetical protein